MPYLLFFKNKLNLKMSSAVNLLTTMTKQCAIFHRNFDQN